MHTGIELNQGVLVEVLQNKLAQAVVREAQMEAAIQNLMTQVRELQENPFVEVKQDANSAESE